MGCSRLPHFRPQPLEMRGGVRGIGPERVGHPRGPVSRGSQVTHCFFSSGFGTGLQKLKRLNIGQKCGLFFLSVLARSGFSPGWTADPLCPCGTLEHFRVLTLESASQTPGSRSARGARCCKSAWRCQLRVHNIQEATFLTGG